MSVEALKEQMTSVRKLKDEVCTKIVNLERDYAETTARIKELVKARDETKLRALRGLKNLESAELDALYAERNEHMATLKILVKRFEQAEGPIEAPPSKKTLYMPSWKSKVSNRAISIPRPNTDF